MEDGLRNALLVAALLPAVGCWHGGGTATPAFEVVRVSPDLGAPDSGPLLLNDAITVYFSAAVNRLSVTSETFAVLDESGHPRPGRLRVGGTWVTFEPTPPLAADLGDGTFRPGAQYRLVVPGYPQRNVVEAADGRRLDAGIVRTFRAVAVDALPADLPSPLRPIAGGTLPFLYRQSDGTPGLPVDDPRVRLHFTLPVLPSSLSLAAFEVILLPEARLALGDRRAPEAIVPRGARLLSLPAPIDDHPGSTVELDLGSHVRSRDSGEWLQLQSGDIVWIRFPGGEKSLRDYSARPLQGPPGAVQGCLLVPGSAVTLAQWPTVEDGFPSPDLARPGFEVAANGSIRPLVRLEAGDGSLGTFRPVRDTLLEPGRPFDRGDGVLVHGNGNVYSFAAIDIPAGVTVRVASAGAPVQIQALGGIRIAGIWSVAGAPVASALRSGDCADVATIAQAASVCLCAGNGIRIEGAVHAESAGAGVALALVAAGPIELLGPIPLGSILANEQGAGRIRGTAERYLSVTVRMTPGLPAEAEAVAVGLTPFRALLQGLSAGVVRLDQCDPAITAEWQAAPADPLRPDTPDLDPARMTPPRPVADGESIEVLPGGFVRMRCTARVRGGEPLPTLSGIRWLDRE